MNSAHDVTAARLDHILQTLQAVNVNIEGMRVALVGLTECSSDHEGRLRGLERWQNRLNPVIAAITFLLGVTCTTLLGRVL